MNHIQPDNLVQSQKKGRPLSFSREAALHQAMLIFWERGYEAASLQDLTSALGVNPSSIYTAFRDKKSLFLEAVGLYMSGPVNAVTIIDQAATAREAAWGLLEAAVTGFTGTDTPRGCLLASSAITGSVAAVDVRKELSALRRGIEDHLRLRIIRAVDEGEMPTDADADALAGHTTAVIQGMSTLARDGATREKLLRVAKTAMLVWPI